MSQEVQAILHLTQTLSAEHQWQLVQALLEQLRQESIDHKHENDVLDHLNPAQKKRLASAIEESEKGNLTSHHEVKEAVKQWLTK